MKEEQISAMAMPTNQENKEKTTQPQTRGAGPTYCRLLLYRVLIPMKSVIVEKETSVMNSVCRQTTHGCTSEPSACTPPCRPRAMEGRHTKHKSSYLDE